MSMQKGLIGVIILLAILCWWSLTTTGVKDTLQQYIENGEILTLEPLFAPDQILKEADIALRSEKGRVLRDPVLAYSPLLLMRVKYTLPDKRPREGTLLWSLVDGEIILDTDTWDKTHGFEDAIKAKASRDEFALILALAKAPGATLPEDKLSKILPEGDRAKNVIQKLREKHLIVPKGNAWVLHFQDPQFIATPSTKMTAILVAKPYQTAQLLPKKYTRGQIEWTAEAAFGEDFAVREVQEVYLPIYAIEAENPDGSILRSFWNGRTGRQISNKKTNS